MIQKRWQPSPAPEWIACVPSLRHPKLVPDFARQLADSLSLPFIDCISKTKETSPQKEMENSYQQAHNLDGSLLVHRQLVRSGALLLVDDMIDSGWTFTVAAALLREAGSGPVFPFALAKTYSK